MFHLLFLGSCMVPSAETPKKQLFEEHFCIIKENTAQQVNCEIGSDN